MAWQPYPRWVTNKAGQRQLVQDEAQEQQATGHKAPAGKAVEKPAEEPAGKSVDSGEFESEFAELAEEALEPVEGKRKPAEKHKK